ncbi:hypothetical protein Tco_0435910 [Tanacetum coccineum]
MSTSTRHVDKDFDFKLDEFGGWWRRGDEDDDGGGVTWDGGGVEGGGVVSVDGGGLAEIWPEREGWRRKDGGEGRAFLVARFL